MKKYVILFFTMLKIGLFTFGGGYAMIALLENELIRKKQWLEEDEFMDMVAIAESTPGPVAVNAATYVGYKIGGVPGALLSTLAVCIPSFAIIYVISLYFGRFLSVAWVNAAFRGIQVCVAFLILSAGWKLFKKMRKNAFNLIVFSATAVCTLAFSLFSVKFSSVFYVLIGAALGICVYLIGLCRAKKAGEGDK